MNNGIVIGNNNILTFETTLRNCFYVELLYICQDTSMDIIGLN
jgi:hypothetical protein